VVVLRDERDGEDHRYLTARRNEAGDLLVEGEDWGPATRPVSSDGEYEWGWTVPADKIPELLRVLDADPEADVLHVLSARFSGAASYVLERRLRESRLASPWVL
jgi:hypothetical protein